MPSNAAKKPKQKLKDGKKLRARRPNRTKIRTYDPNAQNTEALLSSTGIIIIFLIKSCYHPQTPRLEGDTKKKTKKKAKEEEGAD